MPNISGATGRVTVNGQVYTMSPITDRDVDELNVWLRAKLIAAARESLPKNAPPAMEDKVMSQAMKAAAKLDWMADASVLETPENLLHLMWQLMRKAHPDLSSEQFTGDLLKDPPAIKRCRDAFRLLHPLLSGDEEMPGENPTQGEAPNNTTGTKSGQTSSTKERRRRRKNKRKRKK